MRIALTTAFMICWRLARSFGFPSSATALLSRGARPHLVSSRSHCSTGGLPKKSTTLAAPTANATPAAKAATAARSMVLRPDWEREGRVFGLEMPSRKKGQRAFEYLVDFPCEFEIKVIGVNEGSFADDIAATVSAACQVCSQC